jgi:hypothetical protein
VATVLTAAGRLRLKDDVSAKILLLLAWWGAGVVPAA